MREFTVEGKPAKMNERDYAQLLKRFDATKAELVGKIYTISVSCICGWYECCEGCPFPPSGTPECGGWVSEVIGIYRRAINLGEDTITWSASEDTKARQQVQQLREALLSMKKVGTKEVTT